MGIQVHTTLFKMSQTKVYVDASFVPTKSKRVTSIRVSENIHDKIEEARKYLKYDSLNPFLNDLLFAFLRGDLVDISRIEGQTPNLGKIQEIQEENERLIGVNNELYEQITLYKSEIQQLLSAPPTDPRLHQTSVNTPTGALNGVNSSVNTSVNMAFTQCKQIPKIGVNTDFEESVNSLHLAAESPNASEFYDEEDNHEKIQELEAEIDKYLAEKDLLGNKLESSTKVSEGYKYAVPKCFDYLCTEIDKAYGIPLKPASLHDILNHFRNEYDESHEISTD